MSIWYINIPGLRGSHESHDLPMILTVFYAAPVEEHLMESLVKCRITRAQKIKTLAPGEPIPEYVTNQDIYTDHDFVFGTLPEMRRAAEEFARKYYPATREIFPVQRLTPIGVQSLTQLFTIPSEIAHYHFFKNMITADPILIR